MNIDIERIIDLVYKRSIDLMEDFELSELPDNEIMDEIEYITKRHKIGALSESICNEIVSRVKERIHGIKMSVGQSLDVEENPGQWMEGYHFDYKYWKCYKKYLFDIGFPNNVIARIEDDTEKIIKRIGNPNSIEFTNRGMVVGHVQSGKTANFIGVINRAADIGFKFIIVLAGMQTNLREQTQLRIDEGFIGLDTSTAWKDKSKANTVGVGKYHERNQTPQYLTQQGFDFNKEPGGQIRNYNGPVVLVVKKNGTVLKKVASWIEKRVSDTQENRVSDIPLLILDDECDQASLNTKDENQDNDPTVINERIRKVLSLFHKKSYLAYTATPFANVFIDPDSEHEMLQDNLFPKDFIYSLNAPSNYFGPHKLFGDLIDFKNRNVRILSLEEEDEIDGFLPFNHKSHTEIMGSEIPESLKKAIISHVISKAIRILRGQGKKHHSMLIHLSRYMNIHSQLKDYVMFYVNSLRDGIKLNYKREFNQGIYIDSIYDHFCEDFNVPENWAEVKKELYNSVSELKVFEVNGQSTDEELDYKNYKGGLNVIVIGGDKLSRGFTIEGLTTSYFHRTTKMYDTLLQMGRWFGYRVNYEDLCRIYMTERMSDYFGHITSALEDLRDDFQQMIKENKKPSDFGLKVRRHPGALMITARNKMRKKGGVVSVVSDPTQRPLETYKVSIEKNDLETNKELLKEFISSFDKYKEHEHFYGFNNVESNKIKFFIENYRNSDNANLETKTDSIIELIDKSVNFYPTWDVILVSNRKESKEPFEISPYITVNQQFRKSNQLAEILEAIELGSSDERGKGTVSSGNNLAERFGMDSSVINDSKIDYFDKNKDKDNFKFNSISEVSDNQIPKRYLRKYRKQPLLILHVINTKIKMKVPPSEELKDNIIAYTMIFPKKEIKELQAISYQTNLVYSEDDEY